MIGGKIMRHLEWVRRCATAIATLGLLLTGAPAGAQGTGASRSNQPGGQQNHASGQQGGQGTAGGGNTYCGDGAHCGGQGMMGGGQGMMGGQIYGTGSRPMGRGTGAMAWQGNLIQGEVTSVNPGQNSFKLADSEKTFTVTGSTVIVKDRQRVPLSAIRQGDQVRAHFTGNAATVQADRVIAFSAAAAGRQGTTPPSSGGDQGTGSANQNR